jgi:hypothetical protein
VKKRKVPYYIASHTALRTTLHIIREYQMRRRGKGRARERGRAHRAVEVPVDLELGDAGKRVSDRL